MLILPGDTWVGTLSGGCVEEEVALRALPVMENGMPVLFSLDTQRRFGCPGLLEIFIERIEPQNGFLTSLAASIADRRPAEVVVISDSSFHSRGSYTRETAPPFADAFRQTILPPIRLVAVGKGADTDALAGFGNLLGWDVIVLEQVEAIDFYADARTALVVKNHHFGRDVASLARGLSNPFGYVGLLSSRKRKRQLMNVLEEECMGFENGMDDRFYAPSGLDMGADSPEEVALSIIAEIQTVLAGHDAGFLRNRSTAIHELPCKVAAL
jgi:xanthine dehydrogenase accessory factor